MGQKRKVSRPEGARRFNLIRQVFTPSWPATRLDQLPELFPCPHWPIAAPIPVNGNRNREFSAGAASKEVHYDPTLD